MSKKRNKSAVRQYLPGHLTPFLGSHFTAPIHSYLLNAPSMTRMHFDASRMPQKKPAAKLLQHEPAG